ncbi:hypothetical protein Clacol_008863 [Clathrus columnatus]|uniref:Uncharacterized protein n=1 Tax=Clathrus columnatus TaxID=1419009 RepID=A0AAV5AIW7_9AGAM|nr:hypothetical protein Clacol_008863 [Clathrus columnatus]
MVLTIQRSKQFFCGGCLDALQLVSLQAFMTQLQLKKLHLPKTNKHHLTQLQLFRNFFPNEHSAAKDRVTQLLLVLSLHCRRVLYGKRSPVSTISFKLKRRVPNNHLAEQSTLLTVVIELLRFRQLFRNSEASRLSLFKANETQLRALSALISRNRRLLLQIVSLQRKTQFLHAENLIMKRINRIQVSQRQEERKAERFMGLSNQQLIIQVLIFRKMLRNYTVGQGTKVVNAGSSLFEGATFESEALKLSLKELQAEKLSLVTALASVLQDIPFLKLATTIEVQQPIKETIIALALGLKALRQRKRYFEVEKPT